MSERTIEDPIVPALVAIAKDVLVAEHWITPAGVALEGLRAAEAAWKPAPDQRSVWEIVLHLTAWTEWVSAFLQGRDTEVVDWPPVAATDEAAWTVAREAFDRSQATFRERIAALTPESLFETPVPEVTQTTRFLGLASILVHNAYHAGQLVKLREQIRGAAK